MDTNQLYNKLSEQDINTIQSYIDEYAYTEDDFCNHHTKAPLDYILRYWNSEKETLFHMFGDKFILSKEYSYSRPIGLIIKDIEEELWGDSDMAKFKKEIRNLVVTNDTETIQYTDKDYYRLWRNVLSAEVLAQNVYNGAPFTLPLPDGKSIRFDKGCKPVKMLGKVAKAYNIAGFEEFRLRHSQLLNAKEFHGTMCLSIHPLDFMTMSDNECDWSSCMSWQDEGCYRSGTVECMNSPLTIVAYLKSDTDMSMPNGTTWSNKKWRSLFLVTDNIITNVKGYPYRNDEFNEFIINWIKELRSDINYGEPTLYSYFSGGIAPMIKGETMEDVDMKRVKWNVIFEATGNMYNDFGTEIQMGAFVEDELPVYDHTATDWRVIRNNCLRVDYSGMLMCMHCGKSTRQVDWPSNEAELMCEDCCETYEYCAECDSSLSRSDAFTVDGELLCEYCYENCTVQDLLTEETHRTCNCYRIILVPNSMDPSDAIKAGAITRYIYNVPYSPNTEYPSFFTTTNLKNFYFSCENIYYVYPEDLTSAGLDLFEIYEDFESLDEYKDYLCENKERNNYIF